MSKTHPFRPCAADVVSGKKETPDLALLTTRTGKPKATPGALPKSPAADLTPAQTLFQGQRNAKKKRKIARLEQWVEVRVEDGRTTTTLYPSNDQLIKRGQSMLPAPEFVYRRLNFPDGIPDEYDWTCQLSPGRKERGGCGTQRMTINTWLAVIALEAARADGHIGPSGEGNLPRPEAHGLCECPACTANAHRAEIWQTPQL